LRKDKIIDKTSVNYWFVQKQLLLLPSENLTSGVQQVEESHPTVLT